MFSWAAHENSLAVCRIALGFLLIFDILVRCEDLVMHYSSEGIVPIEAMLDMDKDTLFSLYFAHSSTFFVQFLFLLNVVCNVFLIVGYKTTWATITSWIFLVSLHNRNVLVLNSGDDLIRLLLFWGMFLPLGKTFSVDNILYPREAKNSRILEVPCFAWKLQLAWMYIETFILKSGPIWKSGLGAYHALADVQFTTPLGCFLRDNLPIVCFQVLSHSTLVIECIIPIAILFPSITRGPAPIRFAGELISYLAITLVVLLHFGFAISMELGMFPFIPMAGVLSNVPPSFWKFIARKTHSLSLPWTVVAPPNWYYILLISSRILGVNIRVDKDSRLAGQEFIEVHNEGQNKRQDFVQVVFAWTRCLGYSPSNVGMILYAIFFSLPVLVFMHIFLAFNLPFVLLVLVLIPIVLQLIICIWRNKFVVVLHLVMLKFSFGLGCALSWMERSSATFTRGNDTLKSSLCLILLVYVSLLVSQPHTETYPPGWESISWIAPTLRVDQYWGMFAPDPPAHTGYWSTSITVRSAQGKYKTKNLFPSHCSQKPLRPESVPNCPTTLEPNPLVELDNLPSSAYKGQRWRKYFMNIRLAPFQPFAVYYLESICNQWNENLDNISHGKLVKVELTFHSEQILSPFPAPKERFI